jgi:N-acetylglucosaminyl-diphospho-decaprenol L-rhamnosyltransferase
VSARIPDLSVIIVSFNTRALLEACLRSLGGTRVTLEVFVVDNGSTDGSVELVRTKFPHVRLLLPGRNLGFAAANNLALRRSTGRHVLLLNPDAAVEPGALEAVVDFLDRHPDVGALGGRLTYGDGSFQHSVFCFPTLLMIFLDFFPLNHRLLNSRLNGRYPRCWYDRSFDVDHPLGAFMAVRRTVLEDVGLLDPSYFMYCEEIDWAYRLHRAGWRICYVSEARAVHHAGQSTARLRRQMFVELHRSRYLLYRRYHSILFTQAARALVRACCLATIGRDALLVLAGRMDPAIARSRREAMLAAAAL